MINRVRGLLLCHVLMLAGIAVLFFWLLCFFAPELGFPPVDENQKFILSTLIAAAFALYLLDAHLAEVNVLGMSLRRCHRASWLQTMIVLVLVLGYLVAIGDYTHSRLLLLYLAALYPALVYLNRYPPPLLGSHLFQSRWPLRTLLCGYSEDLPKLQHWIDLKSAYGLQVLDFIPIEASMHVEVGDPFAATLGRLKREVDRFQVNRLIVTRALPPEQMRRMGDLCVATGAQFFIFVEPRHAEMVRLERAWPA